MKTQKTIIHVEWNSKGIISTRVTGESPHKNTDLWVLGPSVPMVLANQLGILRPHSGLVLCKNILRLATSGDAKILPINHAMKSVNLDLRYNLDDGSVLLTFWPEPNQQKIDREEEINSAIVQILSNYSGCIFQKLDKYNRSSMKQMLYFVLDCYFAILEDAELSASLLTGMGATIKWVSKNMVVFDKEINYAPQNTLDDWLENVTNNMNGPMIKLEERHKVLCKKYDVPVYGID